MLWQKTGCQYLGRVLGVVDFVCVLATVAMMRRRLNTGDTTGVDAQNCAMGSGDEQACITNEQQQSLAMPC